MSLLYIYIILEIKGHDYLLELGAPIMVVVLGWVFCLFVCFSIPFILLKIENPKGFAYVGYIYQDLLY